MKDNFVSYKIAKKLKELGFDEPCIGYYTPMKDWMISTNPKYNPEPHFIGPNWSNTDNTFYFMYIPNSFGYRDKVVQNSEFTKAIHNIAVPLWQQVLWWLEDNYQILIQVEYNVTNKFWLYNIFHYDKKFNNITSYGFESRKEALDSAVLKAIKIIENEPNNN